MWITPPDQGQRRPGNSALGGDTAVAAQNEILSFLRQHRGQSLMFMSVVSQVAASRRHGSNRQRVQAKLCLIRVLGRLVREGQVQRLGRRLVVLPMQTEPILPHLFAEISPISSTLTTLA